jgi:hypothetical protein
LKEAHALMLKCKHQCHCTCSSEIGTCINDDGRQAAHKKTNENTFYTPPGHLFVYIGILLSVSHTQLLISFSKWNFARIFHYSVFIYFICKHQCHCTCSSEIGTCINDDGRQAAHKKTNENTRFILMFWFSTQKKT